MCLCVFLWFCISSLYHRSKVSVSVAGAAAAALNSILLISILHPC